MTGAPAEQTSLPANVVLTACQIPSSVPAVLRAPTTCMQVSYTAFWTGHNTHVKDLIRPKPHYQAIIIIFITILTRISHQLTPTSQRGSPPAPGPILASLPHPGGLSEEELLSCSTTLPPQTPPSSLQPPRECQSPPQAQALRALCQRRKALGPPPPSPVGDDTCYAPSRRSCWYPRSSTSPSTRFLVAWCRNSCSGLMPLSNASSTK